MAIVSIWKRNKKAAGQPIARLSRSPSSALSTPSRLYDDANFIKATMRRS
jgi:hypothetical protein